MTRIKTILKKINWYALTLICGLSSTVFLFTGQIAINAANAKLTKEIQDCSKEFQAILKERSELVDLTDQLALEDDQAQIEFNKNIGRPPVDIAPLPIYDPKRIKWFQSNFVDFNKAVNDINNRRKEAIKQRMNKHYPEVLCGM